MRREGEGGRQMRLFLARKKRGRFARRAQVPCKAKGELLGMTNGTDFPC